MNLPGTELRSGSVAGLSGWGNRKSLLRGLGLIAGTALIFYLLFRQIDAGRMLASLREVPPGAWIAATLLTLSFPVMSALRWHYVLRAVGHEVSVRRCLLIIMGVWPISAISPSKSGDLLKAVSLRGEISPLVTAGSVVAERVLDVLMLALFALFGAAFFGHFGIFALALAIVLGVAGAIGLAWLDVRLPIGSRLQGKVRELLSSLRELARQPNLLALVLFWTAANWFASVVQTKILFAGVGASVPLIFTLAALPIAIFVGLLPVTFAGMGTRDAAMVLLFAPFATNPQALAAGLLYTFFGYWLLAVLGIPFTRKALAL